ncbi:hypothetical protein KKF81_01925 [Candidatus Micrarchaeota archaeon]|nr:hypothetical protein [Candidatus Micrarchaeota archaeon]MBU1165678.1 hypothetical protein [Candidatus Micrarchaeota archaeon]MBU1887359.1 hypothetical protein [Candidatus Micrarchaeota archaeon]
MKVCVFCQENVDGKNAIPVKEDRIIRIIRKVKKALNIAQLNELYVCEDDLKKHKERRKTFEKSMLFASVLAGVIVLIMIGALVLSGRFDIGALVSAFIIGAFVLILPIFRYAPALESDVPQKVYSASGLRLCAGSDIPMQTNPAKTRIATAPEKKTGRKKRKDGVK